MPRYQTPDGNLIIATQEYIDEKYPGSILIPDPPPPPPPISKLEYMNRFTDTELAAIYSAAKTNIAIEVWLEKFKAAEQINLRDQRTIDGLNALVAVGILTPTRVSEILGES